MAVEFTAVEYVKTSKPPKIRFHLKFTNEAGNLINIYGFSAELRLIKGIKTSYNPEDFIYLGELHDPHSQVFTLHHKDSREIYLDYTLYPYTKNVIEQLRNGDIVLRILLRYLYEQLDEFGVRKNLSSQWAHVKHRNSDMIRIHNSQWADILTQAGFGSYQIIEIPINYETTIKEARGLRDHNFAGRLKKASEHLDHIMRKMDEGEWGEVVGECRIALEALTKGNGAGRSISTLLEASGFPEKNVKSFRTLLEQLKTFTSLKHHAVVDGEAKDIIVPMGREDALFAISSLTTIINLLIRKFLRQPNLQNK